MFEHLAVLDFLDRFRVEHVRTRVERVRSRSNACERVGENVT